MSATPQSNALPGEAAQGSAPLHPLITRKLPSTLLDATEAERSALRRTGMPPLPWVEQALGHSPSLLATLHGEYATHRRNEALVRRWLTELPDPRDFAEPLLQAAIKARFGLDLDVRAIRLFNAGRVMVDDSFVTLSQDPVVRVVQALKAATQSLLDAALQNFEAHEAEPGGMDKDGQLARVFWVSSAEPNPEQIAVAMAPSAFAALCRELDLGGRYQRLIDSVFNPPGERRSTTFKAVEASTLRLNLHLAYLRSQITKAACDALQALVNAKTPPCTGKSYCAVIDLWDVELTGVLLFRLPQLARDGVAPVVLYVPGDPVCVMQQFSSAQAACLELRTRLRDAGYRTFFARFIPARERAELLRRLYQTFYPRRWNKGGWYEEGTLDEQTSPRFETVPLELALPEALLARKLVALRDDGRFHAVPTAVQDHKSLMDKVRYFTTVTVNVLNAAAFVVPGLGELMMAVAAAQAGYEIFEGIDSLAQGERDQALAYLMDVVENVAAAAALGVASSAGAVKMPSALEGLRPVRLADGSTRWWKPDLAPFAHDTALPLGLEPDAQGLYDHQGRQWLKLDGQTYAVEQAADGVFRLKHPSRPFAYQPALRHNGAGTWLHELDQPQTWQGLSLFRRLGPLYAGLSDERALQVLAVSDTREAELRHLLVEGGQAPALLRDVAQRFHLAGRLQADGTLDAATFDGAWEKLQPTLSAEGLLLQRQFPGLPGQVVEEILAQVSPGEWARLSEEGRVPLRVAEEALAYQRKVRLARAREGLYLDIGHNPDSGWLLWDRLASLPGWPPELSLESRDGWVHGNLLGRIGDPDAAELRVLIESAEGYRAAEGQVTRDWHDAVLQCLAAPHREALGIVDKASLQAKLRALPAPDEARLRHLLNMQALEPGTRSPMRLADGRIGYPLSGRPGSPVSEATLLDKLRLLELTDAHPEQTLQTLYEAGLSRAQIDRRLDQVLEESRALRQSLIQRPSALDPELEWLQQTSRQSIEAALWQHWRSRILPERGQPVEPLRLESVHLGDFPDHLPASFCEGVQRLELSNVVPLSGFEMAVDGDVIRRGGWDRVLPQFPALTSLEIRGGNWYWSSSPFIVEAAPLLQEVRLVNLHLRIEQVQIDSLARLRQLRRLDLSGNRFDEIEINGLQGLQLDYLGLERCSLQRWPQWLDSTSISRIREVSLADNQLTELPAQAFENAATRAQPVRLNLEGNRLPWRTVMDLRLSERRGQGFTYRLTSSEALESQVDSALEERAGLGEVLERWVEGEPHDAAQAMEPVGSRRLMADTMLAFWRDQLEIGHRPMLNLQEPVLDNFVADLPAFFLQGVRRMELVRPRGDAAALGRFLQRFNNLEELLVSGVAQPLDRLPQELAALNGLQDLSVTDASLTIDQQVMDFLGAMPALRYVQLDGNRLGEISNMRAWSGRVRSISLARMALTHWPEWLQPLLPASIEFVNLDGNQLTDLPAFLLENHRSELSATEISLRGNPLTREVMTRAHMSQHFNRPYSFSMDLPPEIACLHNEAHSSDSEVELSWDDTETDAASDEAPVGAAAWNAGTVEENEALTTHWEQLQEGGSAGNLLGLIERLRQSADYRNADVRAELSGRVREVLQAAVEDPALRALLDGMALEPLRQFRNQHTCPDGIRMEFNQMEIQVFTGRALRELPAEHRGEGLYRLMRRLFRSQRLDSIAREQAVGRDEAEVRLAYRLRWARTLDLPQPPRHMLFRNVAGIRDGELDRALERVIADEAGQALLDYASQCDFWTTYLRETHADAFRRLKDDFERSVTELFDRYPNDSAEQSSARIRALEEQFRTDEASLLQTLTYQAGQQQG